MFRFLVALWALALMSPAPAIAQAVALPEGVWRSPGYGYIAWRRGERVQTYDISAAGCVVATAYGLSDFHEVYGAVADRSATHALLRRAPTQETLIKLQALPPACRAPLRGKDPEQAFAVFTQTFRELYPTFAERGVDWEAAVARARPKAKDDLFGALVSLIEPLNDDHVTLSMGEREHDPNRVIAPAPSTGVAWSWGALRSSLRDYMQGPQRPLTSPAALIANRRVMIGKTDDGFGYIAILSEGGWSPEHDDDTSAQAHAHAARSIMAETLTQLKDARGLIIDLRVNSGGFDAVAMETTRLFANERVLAFRKEAADKNRYDVYLDPSDEESFNKPIAVLIGENTVSAGETRALALSALPNARLFGRNTRGALSDAIPKTIHKRLHFTLSVERVYSPEGDFLEARGLSPDVAIAPPVSGTPQMLWRPEIDAALEWLRAAEQR
jgi:hypothetical protein